MSTENIAHEKRYRDWRAQHDAMFAPENRSPQLDEQFPLTDGYSIRSKAYIYDRDLHLCDSESELLESELLDILARYAVCRESTGTNHARLLITFSWYEYHMEQKPPADIFRKVMNTR